MYRFSGKRIKRGLYRASDGTLINADVNGAYNILRKYLKVNSIDAEISRECMGAVLWSEFASANSKPERDC